MAIQIAPLIRSDMFFFSSVTVSGWDMTTLPL